jgi:hypothetical protein
VLLAMLVALRAMVYISRCARRPSVSEQQQH